MKKRANNIPVVGLVILGILVLGGVLSGLMLTWPLISGSEKTQEVPEEVVENIEEPEEEATTYDPIDFQPVIDNWVKTVGGNKSVYIYDLNLNQIAGSYNISEKYSTASLYKLFVVYEGYKRVESGAWDSTAKAGKTGKTILECLDLAIRESNSDCAEYLWSLIGHDELDLIIENEWGIKNSDISKLISNAEDITKMMKRFYEHPDFKNAELLNKMWDSFLNQPATTYNWRQGLPSGFVTAQVFNKVGWDYNPDKKYWNIYHDTAIVKFPLGNGTTRDFIVTVLTNKVDFKYIKNLGNLIENHFR